MPPATSNIIPVNKSGEIPAVLIPISFADAEDAACGFSVGVDVACSVGVEVCVAVGEMGTSVAVSGICVAVGELGASVAVVVAVALVGEEVASGVLVSVGVDVGVGEGGGNSLDEREDDSDDEEEDDVGGLRVGTVPCKSGLEFGAAQITDALNITTTTTPIANFKIRAFMDSPA